MCWRAILIAVCLAAAGFMPDRATAQDDGVPTLAAMFARLKACWRSPTLPPGNPGMEITVQFTFTRDGNLLGRPRITYETRNATDEERIIYRTAMMETLQRCVPMPFTNGMGNAIAGRPLTMRLDDRRNSSKPKEKQAWLTTTIL